MLRYLLPVTVFALLLMVLTIGLNLDPTRIPSPLIGRPVPTFTLPLLADPTQSISSEELKGEVILLNVWATWCTGCYKEHPVLVALARTGSVPLYGLNYKDKRADALDWLDRYGDPYTANAVDADGRVAIDWGVYGAPETFVIDQHGIIRYKHIGPLSVDDIRETILPLVRRLREEGA